MEVDPTGAAAAAGLRAGDHLVKVGDIDVTDPSFGPRFRERYARRAGETVNVVVQREGQAITLPLKVVLAERVEERMEFDAKATPKALRIRRGILAGS